MSFLVELQVLSSIDQLFVYAQHKIRANAQIRYREAVVSALRADNKCKQCFIVCDYSAKLLQALFRERQVQFFGKRGTSWFVFYFMCRYDGSCSRCRERYPKQQQQDNCVREYFHLFFAEDRPQDWQDALANTLFSLQQGKKLHAHVEEASGISNHGSGFGSNMFLVSLPFVRTLSGIRVKQWAVSEAGEGKAECDQGLFLCHWSLSRSFFTHCSFQRLAERATS
jgi:hypothetical protein